MMFRLPFGSGALSFGDIQETYKEFVAAMDGMDASSCLAFYYEKNPVTSIFEFRDNDAEADVADAMGIDFGTCSEGESLRESQERKNVEKQRESLKQRKAENGQIKVVMNLWTCYEKASGPKKANAFQRLSSTFLTLPDCSAIPDDIASKLKLLMESQHAHGK